MFSFIFELCLTCLLPQPCSQLPGQHHPLATRMSPVCSSEVSENKCNDNLMPVFNDQNKTTHWAGVLILIWQYDVTMMCNSSCVRSPGAWGFRMRRTGVAISMLLPVMPDSRDKNNIHNLYSKKWQFTRGNWYPNIALYQTYGYFNYPKCVQAFKQWNNVLTQLHLNKINIK